MSEKNRKPENGNLEIWIGGYFSLKPPAAPDASKDGKRFINHGKPERQFKSWKGE